MNRMIERFAEIGQDLFLPPYFLGGRQKRGVVDRSRQSGL